MKPDDQVYIKIFLFHVSSKFDFFIGVDMVMCHALLYMPLICVKEIHQWALSC